MDTRILDYERVALIVHQFMAGYISNIILVRVLAFISSRALFNVKNQIKRRSKSRPLENAQSIVKKPIDLILDYNNSDKVPVSPAHVTHVRHISRRLNPTTPSTNPSILTVLQTYT